MLKKRIAKLEHLTLPEGRDPVTVHFDFGDLGEGEPFTISKIEWLRIKRGMIQSGVWAETPEGLRMKSLEEWPENTVRITSGGER